MMISFNLNRLFGSLSIRKKLRIAFFLSAILPLTIGGIYGIYFASGTLKKSYLDEFTREVEERSQELEKTIMNARGDIFFLSRLPTLKNYVRRMVSYGEPESLDTRTPVLEAFSNFAKYRSGIYQIRFLDASGWERLRVDVKQGKVSVTPLARLQNKSDRYYFREAMRLLYDQVYVSPLDLNEEFGEAEVPHQLVVRIATPFVDTAGQKKGLVVINMYATDLLALIRSMENRPAVKTFFVNTDGTMISTGEDGTMTILSLLSDHNVTGLSKDDLSGGKTGFLENKNYFVIFTPVSYQKGQNKYWIVGLQYPKKIILKPLSEFVVALILIGLVIALVLFFLGGLAARQLTIPLLAIHRGAEEIGKGRFDVHLAVDTRDEIEDLAHAINVMAGKVRELVEKEKGWNRRLREEVRLAELKLTEVMKQAHQMEKMAGLGELSAGIAHEIGNPLAAIKTVMQAMDETLSPEKRKIYFERILSEIDRLSAFLKTFQTFVAPSEEAFVPCDVGVIAENVSFLVEKEATRHGIQIRKKLSPVPLIEGSPAGLQQILLNLMVNAFHAMSDGGEIILETDRSSSEPSKVSLSITDNGVGIPEDNLSRIFDPFFTTRSNGSGLGLAITYKIVKEHGGEIRVKSKVGVGTSFVISFPIKEGVFDD